MNLNLRKIPFGKQAKLPVAYKDIQIGDYTADFAADEKIIVEIKVISQFNSAHEAQAMHYLAQPVAVLPFC